MLKTNAARHVHHLSLLVLVAASAALARPPQTALEERVPWTTSRIQGSPEPPLPYSTERAYPRLTFNRCLDIARMPGSNRLFVAQQNARVVSFVDDPNAAQFDLVTDLKAEIDGVRNIYAITFHPEFEKNRYCYICYIKAPNEEHGTHVARFTVSDSDPPTIDVSTETTILTWLSGGHNGCCLKFGPDGYLYVSTGDGAGPNPPDPKRAGQDLSNLLSAILRIDVDNPTAGRNYGIPADNPFVDLPDARGEIWAYGFRNPWRMSFDDRTGDLWVGDVGWELWELLDRVERGGNYGWSIMEGRQPTNQEWARGPTPILPPTIDHPHSESSSITGGFTYYGERLSKLHGFHIYGDYDTGKIWGFRFADGEVLDHHELADTTHRIVGFGRDTRGELLLLDHTAGTLHRLVPNPRAGVSGSFPRRLSESGLFTDVSGQAPADGVLPYSINAEQWADHATAERFVGVPGKGSVSVGGAKWTFPKDSVLVKTLSLEMERGRAASRRRIETQILHFDGLEWMPYTYRWNDEQTDAELVGAAGTEQTFEVVDAKAPGGVREQRWRFSGRAECQRCHNKWSGPLLGFDGPQLNRRQRYAEKTGEQLTTLAHVKLLAAPVPRAKAEPLPSPRDKSVSLNQRARAYLHVNCAHCHRLHAGGAVLSHMPFELPLEKTNMIGARPTQGTFGIHNAQVIAPGDPFRSVLLYRMSKVGGGRMPHIGSEEVDSQGLDLIEEWLSGLPAEAGDAAPVPARRTEAADLERLATASSEERQRILDRLLSSTTGALRLVRALDRRSLPGSVRETAVKAGSASQAVAVRDLFERYLPPDQRARRLGSLVRADEILAQAGDVERGRKLLLENSNVSCTNCHRIGEKGRDIGPDLTKIGERLSREQILESILNPSRRIEPKFVTWLAETDSGQVVTGLLISRDRGEIVLRDAKNQDIRLAADELEQLVPQQTSLMPELLFRDLTAQQLRDMIAFLASLR